jgi:hypothetical protein
MPRLFSVISFPFQLKFPWDWPNVSLSYRPQFPWYCVIPPQFKFSWTSMQSIFPTITIPLGLIKGHLSLPSPTNIPLGTLSCRSGFIPQPLTPPPTTSPPVPQLQFPWDWQSVLSIIPPPTKVPHGTLTCGLSVITPPPPSPSTQKNDKRC